MLPARLAISSEALGLCSRQGQKRAIAAVGHRILGIVYPLLSRKQPYRDSSIDYEALMVNAPRWIEALCRYGYLSEKTHEISL